MEYHADNGRHVFTLNLGEGAFTALRVVAHSFGQPTPEQYLLDSVCKDTADLLIQVREDEAKELIEWQGVEVPPSQKPAKRKIEIELPEKAHTILAGVAAAGGYDSIEEMILMHESSLAAQSLGDQDEKEYAKMFGLS